LRRISQLNVHCSASRQRSCNEPIYPSDALPPDVYPPLAGFVIPKLATTIIVGNGSSSYVTASDACRLECEAQKRREEIALTASKLSYNLKEARCQKERYAEMEARLISMSQAISTNHDMGDREEEVSACRLTKKMTSVASSATSALLYSSLRRVSKGSKKQNQVSSPAAHYATGHHRPNTPDVEAETALAFFEPGGEAERTLAEVTEVA
jgi:hypothetical protein